MGRLSQEEQEKIFGYALEASNAAFNFGKYSRDDVKVDGISLKLVNVTLRDDSMKKLAEYIRTL